jgi:hypothetical protein
VAWGDNGWGQCDVPKPNTGFTAVAAGGAHSLGLKTDGSIVAWGYNDHGQCDVPEPNTGFVAIAASEFHSLGLKADGSIVAWGDNDEGECSVPSPNTDFSSIAVGWWFSLGLKQDGSIMAWGYNGFRQCDVPAPNTGFISIAAGVHYSLGLKTDGSVVAWGGGNDYGQCYVPAPNTDFAAIAAGTYYSLGLKQDGSIVAWGKNDAGQCTVPKPNANFKAIAAGDWHSLGLKKNIIITKCKVTAGTTQGKDTFFACGHVGFPTGLDFNDVNHIDANIISLTDGASIYQETINSGVVKRKFKYTHKILRSPTGAITSLIVDSNTAFSIKAKKINLTGLACPLRLELTLSSPITGDYKLSGDAYEATVNRTKKLIPTRLMRTHDDTLVVDRARARHNSNKASSDTLSVMGDIAVIDTDVNLCNENVNFIWGEQLFSIPSGSFKASRTGHLFKCRRVAADTDGNTGIVTALVDTYKATFKLLVKGANAIDAASAPIQFGISFADFNETVDVNRVTGRSW